MAKSKKTNPDNVEQEIVDEKKKEILEKAGIDENQLKEIEKKIKEIDSKIKLFSDKIVKKFSKYIYSVGLLPPLKKDQTELNTIIIIDDRDSKKLSKEDLKNKLLDSFNEISKEIDKNIVCKIYLLTQIYSTCDEGKFEILDEIKHAKVFHDTGIMDAIKVSAVHRDLALSKFERYIVSYVCAGTVFTGQANEKSDIDAFVIIDDTDVKNISRFELRDKLTNMMYQMVYEAHAHTGVKRKLHVQTYLLTDFWEYLRDGSSPVIMTFLRDGLPFYDKGIYIPWKQLLKMGRIKPSPESIKMHKETGGHFAARAKKKLIEAFCEDCFYATLNPSQGLLMTQGYPATTPKETIRLMRKVYVEDLKLLDKKWIDILEKAVGNWKKYEYGEMKDVAPKEVQEMLSNVFKFVEEIEKVYEKAEIKSHEKIINDLYNQVFLITKEAFNLHNLKINEKELLKLFKKHLIDTDILEKKFYEILKDIVTLKQNPKKLKTESFTIEKFNKDVRSYLSCLNSYINRNKLENSKKSKINLLVEEKDSEIIFFKQKIFIIEDIKDKEKIIKADLQKNQNLINIEKSNIDELKKYEKEGNYSEVLNLNAEFFSKLEEIFGTSNIKVKLY
ncbi:hypothetical protein HOK68_05260 [Candidatus Woesearchaeota archaeon]|jgi:uncharacterized protein (UPF0332 family)|nr:hypothetical protein [Candidatus Woesearchaeota archaeon]MBT4387608.1 hypothetical protein [Candidatus Woesearchaeota archaeon]MBT4596030.1 hypothetical protein [Candidatus Woesearchaeota archaeon]MBT5740738.1 hypothetical protein [Candidatus Woesearchaeota archaeon]MBT6506158.1 hypothetical protein [Candidatus Woesearchaeota archaeon]